MHFGYELLVLKHCNIVTQSSRHGLLWNCVYFQAPYQVHWWFVYRACLFFMIDLLCLLSFYCRYFTIPSQEHRSTSHHVLCLAPFLALLLPPFFLFFFPLVIFTMIYLIFLHSHRLNTPLGKTYTWQEGEKKPITFQEYIDRGCKQHANLTDYMILWYSLY